MPALPWTERHPVDPEREYVVMASRLPLKGYRFIPGFLRDTRRIRDQLANSEGLVGYALNAQLLRKTFWTFSVWTDQASLNAFNEKEPHRGIVERLLPRMNPTRFKFLHLRGSEIPTSWDDRMAPVRPSP
jgi:hypothetical protein